MLWLLRVRLSIAEVANAKPSYFCRFTQPAAVAFDTPQAFVICPALRRSGEYDRARVLFSLPSRKLPIEGEATFQQQFALKFYRRFGKVNHGDTRRPRHVDERQTNPSLRYQPRFSFEVSGFLDPIGHHLASGNRHS